MNRAAVDGSLSRSLASARAQSVRIALSITWGEQASERMDRSLDHVRRARQLVVGDGVLLVGDGVVLVGVGVIVE